MGRITRKTTAALTTLALVGTTMLGAVETAHAVSLHLDGDGPGLIARVDGPRSLPTVTIGSAPADGD